MSAGNLAAPVSALLSSLGIADESTRTSVEDVVLAELRTRGLTATVGSLRNKALVLNATPAHARLLQFESAALLRAVQSQLPGQVNSLKISSVAARG